MSKKWTHTGAFGHFGAKPRNVQWSWSARTDDKVVVTFWQDQFTRHGDKLTYSRPAMPAGENDSRPGFRELMANLKFAQEELGGLLHVIIAVARDTSALPRSIAHCFPSDMTMQLTDFDHERGRFSAERVLSPRTPSSG